MDTATFLRIFFFRIFYVIFSSFLRYDLNYFVFQFSLCIEDLVPVALGTYIRTLVASLVQPQSDAGTNSENILEKLFALFVEQGNLWADVCSLPEMKGSGVSESSLYG